MAFDCIVIGGGPAGMIAAITAARAGKNVVLLEKNDRLGKKLLITGKGRCNVTNNCTADEVLKNTPRNGKFLFSAMAAFPPAMAMEFFEDAGCALKTERGNRVFPVTDKAQSVLDCLIAELRRCRVTVENARVKAILTEEGRAVGVETQNEKIYAKWVILATGGASYPTTGSTGDGYRMAEACGHTVTPRSAVLSAIETAETWPGELMGLSLRNVTLTMKKGKKTLYSELGEMLFTHFGVSGPLVLTASCHLPDHLADASVTLNLKPGLTREQLDARLQRDFDDNSRKMLRSVLPGLLPARLAELFPALCGVDGDKVCAQITREEREMIADKMQTLPLTLKKLAPIEEAIVTRGGVKVKEVAPATMASKLKMGLYFAGEVIDVDAYTGGFNLQIAFSTGRLAGLSAAEEIKNERGVYYE